MREEVPTEEVRDAVRFTAIDQSGKARFVYSVAQSIGALAISENFILANLFANAFSNLPTPRFCSVENHPEHLGDASVRGDTAITMAPPDHLKRRVSKAECVRVVAFPKNSPVLSGASQSPEALSVISAIQTITAEAYGYADVAFIPTDPVDPSSSSPTIVIELVCARDLLYIKDVIDAVMLSIPREQGSRLEMILDLKVGRDSLWNAWVGALAREAWLNSPELVFDGAKPIGEKGFAAAIGIRFSLERKEETVPHPISTVILAAAMRDAIVVSQTRLIKPLTINTDILQRIYKNYVELKTPIGKSDEIYRSSEYNVYGRLIQSETGALTTEPSGYKAVPATADFRITPLVRLKKEPFVDFVAKSGPENRLPSLVDAQYVVTRAFNGLSLLFILLPTGVFFLGPTRNFLSFVVFGRKISRAEDQILLISEAEDIFWSHLLEAIGTAVSSLNPTSPADWAYKIRSLTLGEILESTKIVDARAAAYIEECARVFDQVMYLSDGTKALSMTIFSSGVVDGWSTTKDSSGITIIRS
jgi:hypothetical protein